MKGASLRKDVGLLSTADKWCARIAQWIAAFSVALMVTLSVLTVVEVAMRAFFFVSIPGFFEVAAFTLAVAILACFPASITGRSHLSIDFVGQMLSPNLKRSFSLLGGVLLLLFLGLLSWRFGVYASAVQARSQTMASSGLALAPFFWTASALLAVCVPMQLVVVLVDLRELVRGVSSPNAAASPARAIDPGSIVAAARRASPRAAGRLLALAAVLIVLLFLVFGPGNILTKAGDSLARNPPALGAIFFFGVWVLILLLVPLGAAMGLTGLAGLMILMGFDPAVSALGFYNARFISNPDLAVLPLFLLMGSFAVNAGLADDIFTLANILLRNWRGGLAQATILGCAGFGSVTGSSVACAAAMGAVSLPEMRRRGYSASLAAGCVAAGGTLGQLIPPSTIIVLYCFLTEVSIGRMFIAVLVPGLITMFAFMAIVSLYVRLVPDAAPAAKDSGRAEIFSALLRCWGVVLMFGLVVGGMYTGIFTANEAAAVGAASSFLFALGRGTLTGGQGLRAMGETAATTAMLFLIIIGAVTFSFFLGTTQFADRATEWILAQNLPPLGVIGVLVAVYLVLGTAMESATILLVTTPVVAPVVEHLGFDLIWWGVVMVVVVEAGIISPPYGLNMFIIQSIQPDITLGDVFRGVMPFFFAMLVVIALLILFPSLILWLPSTMMG